jgi:membrane protein involved in colicin uptake
MAKLPVLITRIDIDAGAERKNYLVQAKQGDKATRFVSVLIVEDGKEYAPPADADLIANFQKPDGKFAYNAAKIDDGNRILVELTNQVLAVSGEVVCEVEIRAKDSSQVLTSCTFTVKVGRSNRNENAILSSNEMTAFDAKWATLNSSMEEYATVERLRVEAEQNRVSAENARVNAETARENAESARNNAETSRTKAETARQTAEGKRETSTQAAIKNAQDATNKATEATKKAEAALADQAELEQTLADCKALKGQTETAASNAAASKAAAETAQKQAAANQTAAQAAKESAEQAQQTAADNQATAEQQAALAGQERAKAEAAAKTAESWTPDGAVDAVWAARLDGTNTSEIFQQYAAALIAQGVDIDTIVRRWFALVWDDSTYGTKLYKFATSATPDGELIQASAELGATKPGTNTTEAVDPYFQRGAFWAVEVAYEIENKEPVVKAVAGVNGVDRETLLSGKFGMVGVAQKTGWVCDTADDNYYYHYYRAAPAYFLADANAYKPLPEGVAVDGSLRPFVIHAKYMAGRGADGKLTSASGLAAVNFISMDGQRAEWKKRGADYCGICGCDLAFRMRMFWAKYGKKGNSGTLEGCSGYSYQYKAAVSETGVTRVIMTAAQADSYLMGSTVSVGDVGTGTSTDRNAASMRAKADKVRILSIEDVTVDGAAYKALNLDTATPFDTEKDKTIVSTMPWHSGSCDNVKGADGSPISCTSGKEPFIIQLLECQLGGYAISADQLTEQVLNDTAYTHRLVFFRQAAQIATSITADAVRSPIVLTMPTTQTSQWMYEKDVEIDADGNMYPVDAGSGASSTNGCRAAVSVPPAGSRVAAWWAWATLLDRGLCGLSGGNAFFWTGTASWLGLCGACGSGANRGEYAGA